MSALLPLGWETTDRMNLRMLKFWDWFESGFLLEKPNTHKSTNSAAGFSSAVEIEASVIPLRAEFKTSAWKKPPEKHRNEKVGAVRALNPCRPFIVSASGRRAYNMRRTFFNWAFSRRAHHLAELWPRVKQSALLCNALADSHLKCVSNCKICARRMRREPSSLRERVPAFGWWRVPAREAPARTRFKCFVYEHRWFLTECATALRHMIMETKGRLLPFSPARSFTWLSCDK